MLTLSPTITVHRRHSKAEADRRTRLRHIEVATRLLTAGDALPADEIAFRHGITRATAYRWLAMALTYEGPEADALRELHAQLQG